MLSAEIFTQNAECEKKTKKKHQVVSWLCPASDKDLTNLDMFVQCRFLMPFFPPVMLCYS